MNPINHGTGNFGSNGSKGQQPRRSLDQNDDRKLIDFQNNMINKKMGSMVETADNRKDIPSRPISNIAGDEGSSKNAS